MLRQVSTNSLAHSPVVHKKLSLVRGELAHQFCQNLSFPLSMMQKFWHSECDTDLLYGSDVCRFGKADRQRRVKCELPNNPVLASDGSELPGVCMGRGCGFLPRRCGPILCAVFSAPVSLPSFSVSLSHVQVTDLQIHPSYPKYQEDTLPAT